MQTLQNIKSSFQLDFRVLFLILGQGGGVEGKYKKGKNKGILFYLMVYNNFFLKKMSIFCVQKIRKYVVLLTFDDIVVGRYLYNVYWVHISSNRSFSFVCQLRLSSM